MPQPDASDLRQTLVELFGEVAIDLSNVSERKVGGTCVSLCDMRYTTGDDMVDSTRSRRTIHQTLVILGADQIAVPDFAATPARTGMVRSLVAGLLGSMGDIDFDDDPQFSRAFQLHGWNETPVRMLFTPKVRSFLVAHPELAVRGKAQQIAIFEPNRVLHADEASTFVQTALGLLERFQSGVEVLRDAPGLAVNTRGKDVMATANRMSGLAGGMLARQLRKFAVSHRELEDFLQQQIPRKIPAGISRQIVGDNFMLIPIGLLFVLVGLAVGISTALTGTSPHLLFTFGFLLMMPLMGGIMAGVAYWYRARKSRVLSDGTLLLGTIASVAHSNLSVDEQVQHIVSIRYPNEAEERSRRTVTCAAYSLGAEEAQRRHKNREAVRLLVDPKDPKHVVCVDFITLFD